MFGPGDALFGTLAHLTRLLPVLPLIGDGHTRLQPVYVEDVAEAVARILADPGTAARTYELAGPTVYTLRELFNIALRIMGQVSALVEHFLDIYMATPQRSYGSISSSEGCVHKSEKAAWQEMSSCFTSSPLFN